MAEQHHQTLLFGHEILKGLQRERERGEREGEETVMSLMSVSLTSFTS